jgi:hypothetical protein
MLFLLGLFILGAYTQSITNNGECKAVGQPVLMLSKGVCVLTGKVLFMGDGFSSLVGIKGDCNKYGPLFNSTEVVACVHTHGDGNTEDVLPLREVGLLERILFWVCDMVGLTIVWAWTIFGALLSLPMWLVNSVMYPIWHYEHWLIVDSVLGGLVIAMVVYWFGLRGRKPAQLKAKVITGTREIASTTSAPVVPPPEDGTPTRQKGMAPVDMDVMYEELSKKSK